jgi:hypothetical protein
MATSKPQTKDAGTPANPIKPVEAPIDDAGLARFTYNVRGGNESLTIRCDDEEELKVLRDRWRAVISPPRRKIPYLHSGDECMVETCRGVMQTRTATNRRTQQPYNFLRCSNHPTCGFTAYLETEENTPTEDVPTAAPITGATPKAVLQNGAANGQSAAA